MTPANAFAPGSPAGAAGIATRAAAGLPPLAVSSSARSGDISSMFSYGGDGFNVNYGNGVSQGGLALPRWFWIAALVAGVVVWKRYA